MVSSTSRSSMVPRATFGGQLVKQPFVIICEAAELGYTEISHYVRGGGRFLCVQGPTYQIELSQLQVTFGGYVQVALKRTEQSPIFDLGGIGEIFDVNVFRFLTLNICKRIADYFFG